MWSTRRSDVSRVRLKLKDVGNSSLESVRTLECAVEIFSTHNVWKGETIDVLNDFSLKGYLSSMQPFMILLVLVSCCTCTRCPFPVMLPPVLVPHPVVYAESPMVPPHAPALSHSSSADGQDAPSVYGTAAGFSTEEWAG